MSNETMCKGLNMYFLAVSPPVSDGTKVFGPYLEQWEAESAKVAISKNYVHPPRSFRVIRVLAADVEEETK